MRDSGREDVLDDAPRVGDDVIVPITQDVPTLSFEVSGTSGILLLPLGMVSAVELNRELQGSAGDIDNEMANDELPSETWTVVA